MLFRLLGNFTLACVWGLVVQSCGPTTLDRHIHSAADVLVVNQEAVTAIRAVCATTSAPEGCAEATRTQHAFVDAHSAWVTRLDAERRAEHWRRPEGVRSAARAVLDAYEATRAASVALGIMLPEAPASLETSAGAR